MNKQLPMPADFQLPPNPMPILVQLGLTYRCNLKCQHCYALYRRDRDEMSFDELCELLDQLYRAGSCAVVYSHGENLIRRDFHEFARRVHGYGMYQTLMANGFYVRKLDDAIKIRDSGINRVLVSLDSSKEEQHDSNRGMDGAYQVALAAVQLLKQAGVPAVGFSTAIDAYNYDDIPEIISIANGLGLDAVSIMQTRYNRPGVFDRALWRRYVATCEQIYELILENRGIIDIYTHDPFMLTILDERLDDFVARADFIGSNVCNVAADMVSIDPTGNVTGCNFIEEVIGNVRKEPFSAIWDRLIQRYSDRIHPPQGPCSGCGNLASCMGGCKAFHYNGKHDERCGETRFGASEPHGLVPLELPAYPTAALTNVAGVYKKRPVIELIQA
jgi:radical SAM protein with 4Fe4S-binding SPASM domain